MEFAGLKRRTLVKHVAWCLDSKGELEKKKINALTGYFLPIHFGYCMVGRGEHFSGFQSPVYGPGPAVQSEVGHRLVHCSFRVSMLSFIKPMLAPNVGSCSPEVIPEVASRISNISGSLLTIL